MVPVKKAADAAGVSSTTIRTWAKDYREFLGPAANPPKGKERRFSLEDVKVFVTIAHLRDEGQEIEQIKADLADGIRVEEQPAGPVTDEEIDEENRAMVTKLTASLAKFEGELSRVVDERDRLLAELDEERRGRMEAEIRAASAEVLVYRRQPWQFWKPKKPEGG